MWECRITPKNQNEAQIAFQGKNYNLGLYWSKKDAIKAREIAEEKIFGDFLRWYEEHKKEIEEGKITDYTVK